MLDDSKILLHRYVSDRSESAFRELVKAHSAIVYGTALRRLGGDRAAAQDVMQEVFTLLARQASSLGDVVLGGWLYRQTYRRCANHVRTETRRRQREQAAASTVAVMTSPDPFVSEDSGLLSRELDEALQTLPASHRDAVVLRYFENRDFQRVGELLGVSEEAARKRVGRALDKLAILLRRKGIVTAAVSLGSTMTGMAATQPPASVIQLVSAQAFQAAPAGSSLSLFAKPFIAGLFVSSALAGGIALVSNRTPDPAATSPLAAHPPGLSPRSHGQVAPDSSFEALIASIRQLQLLPAHAMTTLRLEALLEGLPVDRIGPFLAFADSRLTPEEKDSCYRKLLERWQKTDAPASLSFTIEHHLGESAKAPYANSLARILFDRWLRGHDDDAGQWLLAKWNDRDLAISRSDGSLRDRFAQYLIEQRVSHNQVNEAFDFIRQLPTPQSRSHVFLGICGHPDYENMWMNLPFQTRLDFWRKVSASRDIGGAEGAAGSVVRHWVATAPDEVRQLQASLTPGEKFRTSLELSGIHPPVETHYPGGVSQISYALPDAVSFTQLERDYLAAGLAAGLDRSEALHQIGEVVLGRQPASTLGASLRKWLQSHQDEVNLDDAIANTISEKSSAMYGEFQSAPDGGLQLAACIEDPALRLSLSSALFQRMLAYSPTEAAAKLQKIDLPSDLLQELQARFFPDKS